jgi:hypothetical protein
MNNMEERKIPDKDNTRHTYYCLARYFVCSRIKKKKQKKQKSKAHIKFRPIIN